jgi:predicted nucleic acid-binding protein
LSVAAFVIDASVAISGLSPDERHPKCVELTEEAAQLGAAAPAIWPFEVMNVLGIKRRRGLMSAEAHRWTMRSLRAMNVAIDAADLLNVSIAANTLAESHLLTLYDAAYLELARRLRLPLATLDRRLAAAAAREGVALLVSA